MVAIPGNFCIAVIRPSYSNRGRFGRSPIYLFAVLNMLFLCTQIIMTVQRFCHPEHFFVILSAAKNLKCKY